MSYYPKGTDLTYTPTTPEQERDLFRKAKAGDQEARDFLICNHRLFVAMEGRRIAAGRLPDEDVISAANFAIMEAFDRFDPERGTRFCSFLRHYVHAAIKRLFEQRDAVRTPGKQPKAIMISMDDDEVEYETAPTNLFSLQKDESVHTADHVESFADEDHRRTMLNLLELCRAELTPDEQLLIEQRFGENPKTLQEIGDACGLTRERIRQREAAALAKLREALTRRMKEKNIEV